MRKIIGPLHELLAQRTGLNIKVCAEAQIDSVLRQRMKCLEIGDSGDYLKNICQNSEELQELVEELTVSETWFFRDRLPFELLAEEAQKKRGEIRILSAPCATGEEPYSIAMALILKSIRDFQIDAIDISARAIEQAESGVYTHHSFREDNKEIRDIFFTQKKNNWQISDSVRSKVHFSQGNLCAQNSYAVMPEYDFIFCRNLMIYLLPQARERLLKNLCNHLRPGGLLFTGHSELLSAQNNNLHDCGVRGTFALRKEVAGV